MNRCTGDGGQDRWLERQARVLLHELSRAGLAMSVPAAGAIVEDRVRHAVGVSGLPEAHVRELMTPEHVRAMAVAIARELRRHDLTLAPADGVSAKVRGGLDPSFRATG